MNHLEQLVAEWFEYCGYFVRRNVLVGPRPKGGYECELDVIAYHPLERRLFHVECSLDALAWDKRKVRFQRKFDAGRRHIPALLQGVWVPEPETVALLGFAGRQPKELPGCRVVHVSQLYAEILFGLRDRRMESRAVPEQFPLIRTIQQCYQFAWATGEVERPANPAFPLPEQAPVGAGT